MAYFDAKKQKQSKYSFIYCGQRMCSDFEVPTNRELRRETVDNSELQPAVTRISTRD